MLEGNMEQSSAYSGDSVSLTGYLLRGRPLEEQDAAEGFDWAESLPIMSTVNTYFNNTTCKATLCSYVSSRDLLLPTTTLSTVRIRLVVDSILSFAFNYINNTAIFKCKFNLIPRFASSIGLACILPLAVAFVSPQLSAFSPADFMQQMFVLHHSSKLSLFDTCNFRLI